MYDDLDNLYKEREKLESLIKKETRIRSAYYRRLFFTLKDINRQIFELQQKAKEITAVDVILNDIAYTRQEAMRGRNNDNQS
jgi:hypothetical protein